MSDDFDPASCVWVLNDTSLEFLCEAAATAEEVVVDLETTGLDEYAYRDGPTNGGVPARIVLASFTLPQPDSTLVPTTWILPLSHPESPWVGRWRRTLRKVMLAIEEGGSPLVNHNVKFDARWVYAHTKVDVSHLIAWDTRASSHLLDENRSTRLKARAPETFNVPPWDDFDLSKPGAAERVPLVDLGLYAARDTYWTWRLGEKHRQDMYLGDAAEERPESPEEIEYAKLGRLAVWCVMPTIATLTAVEQRGLQLDLDWVHRELAEHKKSAGEYAADLSTRYEGLNPDAASFAPTSLWFRSWTEAAVNAGDLHIAAVTAKGKPSWSKGVLVRQARSGSEVALALLAQRSHSKKAEFLTSWLNYASEDGVIHSNYNAGSVVTGRLSSDSPNMQAVTAALKPAFIPRPGHVFVDLDYSQIELRVAAFVSRSEPMLEAFRNGWDLHRMLAERITGKPATEITSMERQAGKVGNFGLLYGMKAWGFREYSENTYDISFTEEEALTIYQAFFDTWVGIGAWQDKCRLIVQRDGQISSPIGRVRRLPEIYSENEKLQWYAERSAMNSPVQGFASDLMQMAAASIEGTLPGSTPVLGAAICGSVHDSLLIEVPEVGWRDTALECQHRMVTIGKALERLDCYLDVPLVAEAKVGTRWGLSDVGVLS